MAWDLEQLFWLSQTLNMAKKTLMIICNVFRVSFLNKGNYCSHWLVVSIKINIPLGKRQKTQNRVERKGKRAVEAAAVIIIKSSDSLIQPIFNKLGIILDARDSVKRKIKPLPL